MNNNEYKKSMSFNLFGDKQGIFSSYFYKWEL